MTQQISVSTLIAPDLLVRQLQVRQNMERARSVDFVQSRDYLI